MTANDGDDAKTHALLVTPLFSRSSLPRASSFFREPRRERFVPLQTRHLPRRVPVAVARAGAGAPARRARSHSHASRFPFTAALARRAVSFRFKTVRSTPTSLASTRTSRPTRSRAAPPTARRCTRTRSWRARRTSRHAPAKRARPRSRASLSAGFSLASSSASTTTTNRSSLPSWWVCFLPAPPPPDAPHERRRAVVCRFVHGDAARVNQPPTRLQAPVPRRPVDRGAAILFLRAPRVFAQNVHQVRARAPKAASGGPVQGARAVRVHGRVARGVPARVRDERARRAERCPSRARRKPRGKPSRARCFLCDGTGKNARVVCTVGVFTHRRLRRTLGAGARRLGANEHDERVPGVRDAFQGRLVARAVSHLGNARADLCRLVETRRTNGRAADQTLAASLSSATR